MALVAQAFIEIGDTSTGQPLLRVNNLESIQMPGNVTPAHAELFVITIERLAEDVAERAKEQARQMFNQTP